MTEDLPLDGITVVSIEQAISAPLASRHLADWGARVIKIEREGSGDFCRDYDNVLNGMSSQFVWTNRSKESLAIDIKSDDGKAVLDSLLAKADVFVQNLAPGAAKRQGLDAASVCEKFPSIIACDVSGYGSSGPYANKKAYDLLVQCEAGFLAINGSENEMAKGGIAIVDIATGMYILNGILMGLVRRGRTGRGMAFEVSLFDAITEWMSYPSLYYQGSGTPLKRSGTRHAAIAPYGPFVCGDGENVFLSVQSDREWVHLCGDVLADSELTRNSRFADNQSRMQHVDELKAEIEKAFATMNIKQVMQRLEECGIANARLNDTAGFVAHEQLHTRNRTTEVDSPKGPVPSYLPAITIPGITPVMGAIPELGEHTDAILAELKFESSLPTDKT